MRAAAAMAVARDAVDGDCADARLSRALRCRALAFADGMRRDELPYRRLRVLGDVVRPRALR